MPYPIIHEQPIERVRGILLTGRGSLLLIKRLKPNKPAYWVAPGGGVEPHDLSHQSALHREVSEELGAVIEIIQRGFVLSHTKANKLLEEHFFICHLLSYDLSRRDGPEFADPIRGEYLPDEVRLDEAHLTPLNFKTPELLHWLVQHLPALRRL